MPYLWGTCTKAMRAFGEMASENFIYLEDLKPVAARPFEITAIFLSLTHCLTTTLFERELLNVNYQLLLC